MCCQKMAVQDAGEMIFTAIDSLEIKRSSAESQSHFLNVFFEIPFSFSGELPPWLRWVAVHEVDRCHVRIENAWIMELLIDCTDSRYI